MQFGNLIYLFVLTFIYCLLNLIVSVLTEQSFFQAFLRHFLWDATSQYHVEKSVLLGEHLKKWQYSFCIIISQMKTYLLFMNSCKFFLISVRNFFRFNYLTINNGDGCKRAVHLLEETWPQRLIFSKRRGLSIVITKLWPSWLFLNYF